MFGRMFGFGSVWVLCREHGRVFGRMAIAEAQVRQTWLGGLLLVQGGLVKHSPKRLYHGSLRSPVGLRGDQ
eukprot:628232-Amorphochlora_amoeboformis.AAC.1